VFESLRGYKYWVLLKLLNKKNILTEVNKDTYGDIKFMEYTKFPEKSLNLLSLKQPTKKFLNIIGLPERAAPHLYFGDFGEKLLPRLSEHPWLKHNPPKELKSMVVIGSDGDENPICIIERSEEIVIFNQEKSFEKIFMNSSVLQLAGAVNDFKALVDQTIASQGDWAFVEYHIPSEAIKKFETALAKQDPAALGENTYWAKKIADIKNGVKKFNDMRKYDFELFGNNTHDPEVPSIKLIEVTFFTESRVLRALADFFIECAAGMELHKEKWDHEHFGDTWDEWYRVYPDIIVMRPR
jgi:hypothetical protein